MSWTSTKINMTGPLAAPSLARVIKTIAIDGDEALIVGGAVRNALMGRAVSDVDIATTALPTTVTERVQKAGMKAVPTGIDHGTVTVVTDGRGYEVTTLRRDIDTDGRRATVEFGHDFVGDAHRRDFTINGLYARLDGTVFDPVGGLADIAERRVRFIGNPETRIREDYLRILRFFRFFGDYDKGEADQAALIAIAKTLDGLKTLSRERVRAEFLKILSVHRAAETVWLLKNFSILSLILGEPTAPDNFARAVLLFPDLPPMARLAALIGSDYSRIDRLRKDLRLSNEELRQLSGIIEAMHMLEEFHKPLSTRMLRAVSFRTGKRHALAGLAIHAAGANSTIEGPDITAIDQAPQVSPFTGDMMITLGLTPGPDMGRAIERAELLWIEADMPSNPDRIDEIARRAILVN